KPQRPAAELMGATGRIMVVEDAADVRRVVAGQLRALGFDVISAPDGAAALRMLREGTEVELLLSDLVMPGDLQGPDLAELVWAEGHVDRILFMSGYPEGARRGAEGRPLWAPILQKPVSINALAEAVERALTGPPVEMEVTEDRPRPSHGTA
ncbi:MAG: response regulator, partial [Pseudomonadota bacterium]